MRIPIMRPMKFVSETEEVLKDFSDFMNTKEIKTAFPRLCKDNVFNRRFSAILDTFTDLKSVVERLEENITESMRIGGITQSQEEINQELYKQQDKLTRQNKSDLRIIYVNSKIFLDEYVGLLAFIFNWRGISNGSVTQFYKSLSDYNELDEEIIAFKELCLNRLKAINVYITEYRDDKVVHNHGKHKQETEWFLNNMNGEIRLVGGGRPSITPQEVLFIVVEFVDYAERFVKELLTKKLAT